MQIDHDKEERCARGVHITDNPAARYIAHDVFHRRERHGQVVGIGGAVGFEVHRQENAADDLDNQHEQCERAEEIPKIEVFGCVVFADVVVPQFAERKTRIHPVQQCFGFAIGLICHDYVSF